MGWRRIRKAYVDVEVFSTPADDPEDREEDRWKEGQREEDALQLVSDEKPREL